MSRLAEGLKQNNSKAKYSGDANIVCLLMSIACGRSHVANQMYSEW